MAFKLHEWNDIPYSELTKALEAFDIEFKHHCYICEKEIQTDEDQCEQCK